MLRKRVGCGGHGRNQGEEKPRRIWDCKKEFPEDGEWGEWRVGT